MGSLGPLIRRLGDPPLPRLRSVEPAGDAVRQTIRAYHGSPYDFDRFDASKIGTGEGNQAFGHGLYFAGNEAVARDYRDRLRDLVDRPAPEELGDELQAIIQEVRGLAERRRSAVGEEWHALDRALEDAHVRHQDVQHRIREASYNPGHIYEVEIGYPESDLLDLDAPAKGRHKAALMRAAFAAPENKWQKMAIEEITSRGTPSKIATESLLRAHNVQNENKMLGRAKAQAAVSEALMREGIPGARYFDQFSRTAGEGTRNYVVFPGAEDSIRILRKFAVPGVVGAGAAAMSGEE